MNRFPHLRIPASALLVAALLASALLLGCSKAAERVSDPQVPPPAQLDSPDAAVMSYLGYVTLSYRMVNSELSTQTMTPQESVRVDSYIELNRQAGKGIDQRLQSFRIRSQSQEDTKAVLAATEEWTYRYFSIDSLKYNSPSYQTSYETTYTLAKTEKGWLVDKVDAKALTEVK